MQKIKTGRDDDEARTRLFRGLSEALGADSLSINSYECDPGQPIGLCYHHHHEQEEVFFVISGTATFDTGAGAVQVDTGELIRFAPGEWQQGWNRSDERLAVLALGAPRDEGPTDLRRYCSSCGALTPAISRAIEAGVGFSGEGCGTETGRYADGVLLTSDGG